MLLAQLWHSGGFVMATIRKRKHKYQAQVRRSGFPTITKSFHMLKDAQEWSRQMEIQIDGDELTQDRSVLKETTLTYRILQN